MVLHAPGSYSTMERERGFEDVMRTEFPGIRIVARQLGMANRARARAAAENMLAEHAALDGFFASTETSSSGAALALKGRKLAGKVLFVGFDFSASMVEDLKAGVMDAIVVQGPFGMGCEVIRLLVESFAGRSVPQRVDLHARVVTRADWESPEIQRLLLPQREARSQ